ncbi:Coiled-coil domain-containing protein 87 [Lamellibrachia satsuma]|nr:Coiled-coil domain-containing protein 87 [Lamellibrachia satsuma]
MDPLVEGTADAVNISAAFASSSLSKRREDRVVNVQLQQKSDPPWASQQASEWVKTPQNPPRDKKGQPLIIPRTPRGDPTRTSFGLGNSIIQAEKEQHAAMIESMGEVMARSYTCWQNWWKNIMNSDDYMKYASAQDSDYLGVVFHFYDSADEDDHDTHTQAPSRQISKQRMHDENKKRMSEIWQTKTAFTPGEWNVQSVMLGGLGKDPELGELKVQHQPPPTKQDNKTSSKCIDPKMKVVTKKAKRLQAMYGDEGEMYQLHSGRRSTKQSLETTQTIKETASMQQSLQERLEKVWKSLHMPDSIKLDMAIKYSGDTYHTMLEQAVDEWERVTDLIQQRELLLTRLEKFERLASDPNRFFERGHRGSSVARLDEAKMRSGLYKKIESLDLEIAKVLDYVRKTFDDVVTYQGRGYQEKMKWDRTEMLYWLQEERKQQLFNSHSTTSTANRRLSSLKFGSVPPITPTNPAALLTQLSLEIKL